MKTTPLESTSSQRDGKRLQIVLPEVGLVLLLTCLALGLRLIAWERATIEHFDEGVYAANFYAGHLDHQYPDRHLYAPRLLPFLIEWGIILSGDLHGAMWINLLAGVLLVPTLWCVGRAWFGSAAGLAAATLCTLSDVHLLYSRTALTDPLLTLFIVLAVWWTWKAMCFGGFSNCLVAGLLTGAAWWTKYNGWLPLAISAAGFVGWLIWGRHPISFEDDLPLSRHERRQIRATGARLPRTELIRVLAPRWGGVCLVAVLCWLPEWYALQQMGGYAAVAANHGQYVVGIPGWWFSLVAQVRNLLLQEGLLTSGAWLLLSVSLAYCCRKRVQGGYWPVALTAVLLLVALSMWLGSAVSLLAVSLCGLWCSLRGARDGGSDHLGEYRVHDSSESNLAAWMIAAWLLGLGVTVPFYYPYGRLLLPWLAAGWLGAGLAVSCCQARCFTAAEAERSRIHQQWTIARLWPLWLICLAACIWRTPTLITRGIPGWDDRTGLQVAAQRLVQATETDGENVHLNHPDDVDAVFYVVGEPAVFVHLSALEPSSELSYISQPVATPNVALLGEDARYHTYLIIGPHLLHATGGQLAIPSLKLIETIPYRPSRLIWLDESPGRSPSEFDPADPRWQVRLYRVTSRETGSQTAESTTDSAATD